MHAAVSVTARRNQQERRCADNPAKVGATAANRYTGEQGDDQKTMRDRVGLSVP